MGAEFALVNYDQRVRERLLEALRLKALPRAGWVRAGVQGPEAVASHSWGVAWLVLNFCPPELDLEKALSLAVVHDLAEVRVGDLTPHDAVDPEEKLVLERRAFRRMTEGLPQAGRLRLAWHEYAEGTSREARLVRALDKLDMALQAALYSLDQDLDLEEFVRSALEKLEDPLWRELADPRAE